MKKLSLQDNTLLHQAWKAHREGRLDEARKIYTDLIKKYPDMQQALNALGTVLMDMGEMDQAEACLKRAAEQKEPYVPALYNLARIKQVSGRIGEAKRIYEQIITIKEDFGPAWNNLALILKDEGMHREACMAMQEACRLMPRHAEAFNNLGVMLEAANRFHEAKQAFSRAIMLQDDYITARFNLACLYHRLERFDRAEQELEWIIARQPDNVAARYLLQTLGRLPSPERAPTEYVSKTFDDCALTFEKKLESLEYQTPAMLFQMLEPYLQPGMAILDLGCGTGLGAGLYRDYADVLVGMDCSEKMLNIARTKKIYDNLTKQDLLETWRIDRAFDCIYSSDCLVYFGNLAPVFSRVMENLAADGYFGFSVELWKDGHDTEDFHLGRSGRFAHSKNYIKSCLNSAGFSVMDIRQCRIRKEAGQPVKGLLVVAQRQPANHKQGPA